MLKKDELKNAVDELDVDLIDGVNEARYQRHLKMKKAGTLRLCASIIAAAAVLLAAILIPLLVMMHKAPGTPDASSNTPAGKAEDAPSSGAPTLTEPTPPATVVFFADGGYELTVAPDHTVLTAKALGGGVREELIGMNAAEAARAVTGILIDRAQLTAENNVLTLYCSDEVTGTLLTDMQNETRRVLADRLPGASVNVSYVFCTDNTMPKDDAEKVRRVGYMQTYGVNEEKALLIDLLKTADDRYDDAWLASLDIGTLYEKCDELGITVRASDEAGRKCFGIALADAGFAENEIRLLSDLDGPNGVREVRNIRFLADGNAYCYKIDKKTGEILLRETYKAFSEEEEKDAVRRALGHFGLTDDDVRICRMGYEPKRTVVICITTERGVWCQAFFNAENGELISGWQLDPR